MADRNRELQEELFGSDDDEDFQAPDAEQAPHDDTEAAPAPDAEGDAQPEQEEYPVQHDFAVAAGGSSQAAFDEYQPEDVFEQDQWDGHPIHEEAQEVGENEEDELEAMFKPKKKRRKEMDISEKKQTVESILARMEVAAELDIEANQNRRPAIHKLQMLSDVEAALVQRELHDEFLDSGVLGVMKAWLEPMPDGSLPNAKVRSAVLRLLTQLHFFFEDRKEQLKKSGLGHVIMFLAKLPDEQPANRRMAKELVQKWSRPIFEQYRNDHREAEEAQREADEMRIQQIRQARQRKQTGGEEAGDRPLRPTDKGFRFSAVVPEKAKLNYKVAPASQVAVDANAGGSRKSAGNRSDRMVKKLADIGKRSKQSGKAAKVSVEGRGLMQ